ncbi:hypothetical protein BGZ70_006727 [Mortierella alpina]|uniref:Uncharacterized protein n=1 Tax=Mortierella alpina TaxID=64518 RepID=A0A9P6J7L1_MORAP|nr:hypothetical protein BGZ70_006727 [Mortierella alpina]
MEANMKIAFITIAALISVVAAAPSSSDNTKCSVSGFKINPTRIQSCCLNNMGGFDTSNPKQLGCTLPESSEKNFSNCVKKLGYATVINCAGQEPAPSHPDDMSVCTINGFKVNPSKISDCCLQNAGGAQAGAPQGCNLNVADEGKFRRCVKDLGFATTVDCDYK